MAQRSGYWLAGLAAALCLAMLPAEAADLTLKRVVLSTGGVGYFEYEAAVTGDATLALDVPLDQVDDVLKSLVVYDGGGTAGEITLPGREPLTQSFVDLPFDRAALNSETDLLNALQGAEIRVAAPKAIAGRLVHVDEETLRDAAGVAHTRSRVSVMTDAGLQQFVLQDADAIAFADPALQRQVDTALSRIAAYRATGRRQLTLTVHGTGARDVRVGYVVAMPLWKASYRLSLPPDPHAETARLQGWAVLENFSGRAWQDVELTLLSGNPVTFRQALYESYYVPRPVVPVESGNHVLPPPDTGTVGTVAEAAAKASPVRSDALRMQRGKAAGAANMAMPAAAPAPPPAGIEAGTAVEEATQIAFSAPYKVSVAAGQSLLLPLLDRELPVRRVDLYQPSLDPRHPLAAIELTNKSDTGLPPGVLTLYQENPKSGALYLGDARLAALPAGDKRLLSYALDGKVTIDHTSAERRPVIKATIGDGVMRIDRVIRWTTSYRVKSTAGAAHLLVEQPRRIGASLTAPDPKTVELAAQVYRIPFAVPASGEGSLTVVEEQPTEETIRLLDLDDNRLGVLVSSSELDPKLRQGLAAIVARRQAVGYQRAELARLKDQRAQLVEDETRLRNDLASIGAEPALRKRLLDKFGETETAIETVTAGIAKASDTEAAAERDLAAYIAGLKL
ncbi:MAG TPA: DUF4139 domain-containing protein [Stellaceae bacterium]|nr:DUF4139 domain-containing protein [Stellaceae bacterium]